MAYELTVHGICQNISRRCQNISRRSLLQCAAGKWHQTCKRKLTFVC